MFTTAVGIRKHSMTSRFARLAAGAAVSVALMTTAAPAMASEPPEPRGSSVERTTTPAQADHSVDLSSVALGALSGIALSGAGLGIAYGVQRRRDRSTAHPA
jgi:hypothetical protein